MFETGTTKCGTNIPPVHEKTGEDGVLGPDQAMKTEESDLSISILNNLSCPILVKEASHKIVYANQAFRQMTGLGPTEPIGNWEQFFTMETAKKLREIDEAIFKTNKIVPSGEAIHILPDEGRRFVLNRKIIQRNGLDLLLIEFINISESIRIQNAMKESKSECRLLTDNTMDAIWQLTPDLFFTYVSGSDELMRGYKPEEVLGKPIWEFLPPHALRDFKEKLDARGKMARQGKRLESATYELEQLCKSGQLIWTEIVSNPIYGESGELLGFQGITRDISERKRLETALQKRLVALTKPITEGHFDFTDLFDLAEIQRIQDAFSNATGVASIITQIDGTPITTPSNFCRLCIGIIRQTSKGLCNCMKSDAIIGGYNPRGPIVQPCLSGGLWDAGASITIDGRHIANWLIGQVKNEKMDQARMLSYAVEIGADPVEFEKALSEVKVMSHEQFQSVANALFIVANELSTKAYQNLQQARLLADQQRAEEALQQKNRELERFTFTVSHDLKSPLITISAFSGSLLADLAKGRTDRLERDLRHISSAAEKMGALLKDLLELSRVGQRMNPPSDVPMNLVVKDTLELLSGSLSESEVQIAVDPKLPVVSGDRRRLAQVFQNLLENAVKYMGTQTDPRIEIGWSQEAGAFFVRDNGIGIEPQHQSLIFGLFSKLDAKTPGTGVGLALVQRIVETHGGKTWVESKGLGCGTTFYFTLPTVRQRGDGDAGIQGNQKNETTSSC